MPFTVDIDATQQTALVTLQGIVHRCDFVDSMEACFRHPAWQPGFSALWDAQQIEQLILAPEDVSVILKTLADLEPLIGDGRAAFVVPREIDYMMARLLIHRGGNPVRDRRTFRDAPSAWAWLRGASALRTAS